ncbi:MAG: Ppx/GppA phosphatase family protein [Actinomycetota bacterium]|nr:Ppx/GppA phosphatase family protein [Actinomycetota bacterium]
MTIRLAALDMGSNSFHLLVVGMTGRTSFETLAREKEMLRLGDDVGRWGRIGEERAEAAVASVARLSALARAAGATEIVAKATAALREAENGSDLVDRIESETGVKVDVISGMEEARLVFRAVSASVALEPAPALCIDLGGGSLELMVGDHGSLHWATSVRLGVGRLTAELVRGDPPGRSDRKRLLERIDSTLEPHMDRLRDMRPMSLVGSSGTLLTLVRMAAMRRDGALPVSLNQMSVSRKELEAIHGEVWELPSAERSRLAGLDAKRADILPAGTLLALEVMDRFGLDTMTASEWALREGIVLDFMSCQDSEWTSDAASLRRSSVADLASRFRYQEAHASHVRSLALSLFDQTAGLHHLDEQARELLSHAALLHDVGEHVAMQDHDQHGAYLVLNGRLRGFSPEEISAIATIVRFHRRGAPAKSSFAPWEGLSAGVKDTVLRLTALLRVADALDRSHASVVKEVAVRESAKGLLLSVVSVETAELELWALRRKRTLFEDVFGVDLSLTQSPTDS